jgi:tetratricopeptide (TPR) repeat protein
MSKFSSEGFDLDAWEGDGSSGDAVVYEIGGGATPIQKGSTENDIIDATAAGTTRDDDASAGQSGPPSPLDEAEGWKQRGNEEFNKRNYLEAYDLYTEAILACPCPVKAEDVLRQRKEFDEAEHEKARQRMEEETRRRGGRNSRSSKESESSKEETTKEDPNGKPQTPAVFVLPPQENGDKLAIYYCNRAAALIQMDRYEEAIQDADVACLLSPGYTKAYVRRSSAFEKAERTEEALKDAKKALELEPSNATIRKSVARLQKLEDERLEKLKEETMAKLKDLGNSLLGNFGLSLDNFQAVQDPKTGSYSISFNQG